MEWRGVWPETKAVFALVLGQPWRMLRFALPWYLPLIVLGIVINQVLADGNGELSGWVGGLAGGLFSLLALLAIAACSVTWHRYLLWGTDRAWRAPGWDDLRYAGWLVAVYALFALLCLPVLAIVYGLSSGGAMAPGPMAGLLVIVLLAAIFLIVSSRLAPGMVPIALGRPAALSTAWDATAPMAGRAFLFLALVHAPGLLSLFSVGSAGGMGLVVVSVASTLWNLFTTALITVALTRLWLVTARDWEREGLTGIPGGIAVAPAQSG